MRHEEDEAAPAAPGGADRPATFVVTTPAYLAHLLRVLELSRGLVRRGHRVLVHAPASAAELVQTADATHVPAGLRDYRDRMQLAYSKAPAALLARRPYLLWQVRRAVLEATRELVDELEPLLRRERADCLIYDYLSFGA